jgi:hypothetical protein
MYAFSKIEIEGTFNDRATKFSNGSRKRPGRN